MPLEHCPGSEVLFRNRNHKKNPKSPNLKGDALLQLLDGGKLEIELAAWVKESDRAGRWLSLAVTLKGDRPIRQRFNSAGLGRQQSNHYMNQHDTPVDEPPTQQGDQEAVPF